MALKKYRRQVIRVRDANDELPEVILSTGDEAGRIIQLVITGGENYGTHCRFWLQKEEGLNVYQDMEQVTASYPTWEAAINTGGLEPGVYPCMFRIGDNDGSVTETFKTTARVLQGMLIDAEESEEMQSQLSEFEQRTEDAIAANETATAAATDAAEAATAATDAIEHALDSVDVRVLTTGVLSVTNVDGVPTSYDVKQQVSDAINPKIEDADAATQAANDAATAANSAATSATDAATAATSAITAATQAATAANSAASSATSAASDASAAATSANGAATTATSAASSATSAAAAANEVAENVENVLGYVSKDFSVAANASHSSRSDQIDISIAQGETYYLTLKTDNTDISPQVHEYDANGQDVAQQNTRAIPNSTVKYTALSNVEHIGIYIAAKTTAYSVLYFVSKENSIISDTLKINTIKQDKLQNSIAYVSANAMSVLIQNTLAYLTLDNAVVIRANYGNAGNNIIASITKEDIFAAAQAAGFTVSDNTISGNSFAIVYDFDDNLIKAYSPTNKAVFENTLVLFMHHYSSLTCGALYDSYLAIKHQEITDDIAEIKSELNDALPSYLESEAEACQTELVSVCDEKAMVIAFTTDNHYGASNGANFPTTVDTIKSVNNKYPIDIIIDGGDLINGDESKANDITRILNAIDMFESAQRTFYSIIGNHDDGSFTSTNLPLFNKVEQYALYQRHNILNSDYSSDSECYGYKDFDQFGIRLIYLDSCYGVNGHTGDSWGYSDDEVTWLSTDALNTQNQVVIFSHMGFTKEYSAYNLQVHNGAEMRAAVEAFIANGGVVVALFHGHTHWDFIGQYSQTNGFHEVSTGCSRVVSGPITTRTDYYPQGATMPERTINTVTQELWDIIVIKPESREVNMIRYGAGSDRSFTY